jgi:hypothetical protein
MVTFFLPLLLLFIGIILLLIGFPQRALERRCPVCRRWWAREDIGSEFLGTFRKAKTSWARRSPRRSTMGTYEKYRIYHRCKICKRRWSSIKIIER